MKKKLIAFFCVLALLAGIMPVASMAETVVPASNSSLIATNIPKSFSIVKQDPSFRLVNFWTALGGNNAVLLNNIVNWFNSTVGKKEKIYVKGVYQGDYQSIALKVQATLQSGDIKTLPDIIQCSAASFFSIKESDRLAYIQDYMNSDPDFAKIKDKLNKNAMFGCSYKGKQAGLPFSNSMIMLHYNVDAFKAVGLDPNNPPKTMAEYATAATKLMIKSTGKKPVRYGSSDKVIKYHLSTLVPRQNTENNFEFNMDNGRAGTPTEYACAKNGSLKATLTEWKKVLDTGAVEYTSNASASYLQQGLSCMGMFSMVSYDTIDQYFAGVKDKSKIFEHRMTRIPTINATDSVGEAIGGSAIYMFDKNDKSRKDAAWEFIKFLCSIDVSAYWYARTGYFPLNNDAIKTKYVQDELSLKPNKKATLKVLSDSTYAYKYQDPLVPSVTVYENYVGDMIIRMAQGKQTIDQAVANIEKKANYLLDTYRNTAGK